MCLVSLDFDGQLTLLLSLTMFICAIRASHWPHRGHLKCYAHYACSSRLWFLHLWLVHCRLCAGSHFPQRRQGSPSAGSPGLRLVVRRIALPPAETGLSISRLSCPASCFLQLTCMCSSCSLVGRIYPHLVGLPCKVRFPPTSLLTCLKSSF